MKTANALIPALLMLAACSETPVEERGEAAIAEMEQKIEDDAQSLEEAADEAAEVLAKEIDAQLATDGIGAPAAN